MRDTGKTETHRRRASFSDERRWKKNDVKDRDAQCEEAAVLLHLETRVLSDPSVLELHRTLSSLCIIGITREWEGEAAEEVSCLHPSLD
jgi:hypothetical protein